MSKPNSNFGKGDLMNKRAINRAGQSDLRVISGRYRGQKLQSPQNSATHPMGAREKLALFNMVNVEAERVLDAYAGTGALGIEALSRGASEVMFVEANRAVGRVLQGNLQRLGLGTAETQVLIEKVGNFAAAEKWQGYFGVILADPPYEAFVRADSQSMSAKSMRSILGQNAGAETLINADLQAELQKMVALLQSDGVLVLSSPADLGKIELEGLRISSTHTYARARITLYRKR